MIATKSKTPNSISIFKSPLRYPGGKSKLYPFFANLIDNHFNNNDLVYIEPYAGGAGLALALLINGKVKQIHINDCDRSIYAFWWSILNQTKKFCQKIALVDVSIDEWVRQKEIQRTKNDADLFDLGFSTFFLNRCNRSGILNAGMIGGWEQKGDYTIQSRFNKAESIKRIRRISEFSSNINLSHMTTEVLIRTAMQNYKTENSLVYFDPPYYKKGSQLYTNFYQEKDHVDLCRLIDDQVKMPWIMTYDNEDFIKSLYKDYSQQEFDIRYSTSTNRKAKEVMIFSHEWQWLENIAKERKKVQGGFQNY